MTNEELEIRDLVRAYRSLDTAFRRARVKCLHNYMRDKRGVGLAFCYHPCQIEYSYMCTVENCPLWNDDLT